MKVYITKHALTTGIQEIEVVDDNGESIYLGEGIYQEGRDYHRTREGAIKHAQEMRARALISLSKRQHKLEQLKFT